MEELSEILRKLADLLDEDFPRNRLVVAHQLAAIVEDFLRLECRAIEERARRAEEAAP